MQEDLKALRRLDPDGIVGEAVAAEWAKHNGAAPAG